MLSLFMQQTLWNQFFNGPLTSFRVGLSSTEPNIEYGNITNPPGNYQGVGVLSTDFSVVEVGIPLTDIYVKNDDFIDFIESDPVIPWGTVAWWTMEVVVGAGPIYELFDYGVITDRITGLPSPVTIGTEDFFSFDPDKLIFRFKNDGNGGE